MQTVDLNCKFLSVLKLKGSNYLLETQCILKIKNAAESALNT